MIKNEKSSWLKNLLTDMEKNKERLEIRSFVPEGYYANSSLRSIVGNIRGNDVEILHVRRLTQNPPDKHYPKEDRTGHTYELYISGIKMHILSAEQSNISVFMNRILDWKEARIVKAFTD